MEIQVKVLRFKIDYQRAFEQSQKLEQEGWIFVYQNITDEEWVYIKVVQK